MKTGTLTLFAFVAMMVACAGLSQATSVSWDGASADIVDLSGNVAAVPNSWTTADSVWSTTDEVVPAVGSQASFKVAIGRLMGQRRTAEVNAGFDSVYVGGNEVAGSATSPYTTLVGFDTAVFGAAEVLESISVTLSSRVAGDTMSVQWFVEAGGSTYISGVVDPDVGSTLKTLTLPDVTTIEWFAFNDSVNIGSAMGASVGTLSLTDVDYVGYYTSSNFTADANWHGAYLTNFLTSTAIDPTIAADPVPSDGSGFIEVSTTLGWGAPTEYTATGYDVYFGTNPDVASNPLVVSNELVTTYDPPGDLAWETPYYWAVDSYEGAIKHEGNTWTFTTKSEPLPLYLEKGPYLIYGGVNTEMQVLWQTNATGSCTIEWGLDTSYSLGNAQTTEYGSDHQHSYTISGLSPGTNYKYRVNGLDTGSFTTAPADNATDVKFFAYGDTRTYPSNHDTVAGQIIDTYTIDSAFQTLILHVGDWIEGDTESGWANHFFPTSYANLVQFKKDIPINGCIGNHELPGGVYSKYYPYPYVNDFYWSFDYGPAHIVILDQYTAYTSDSAQHTWLVNDLANTTKQWKFIVLHEPGWSAGGSHGNDGTVQSTIQPLCLAYGVDIVFGGHNHYYSRHDVDGVQHITTGGGGVGLDTPNMSYPYLVAAEKAFHHTEITITGDQMDFLARKNDGTVIDTFIISHVPDFVTPTPDAATWATEPYAYSDTAITMMATTGSDATLPVWYLFTETTSGPGATDSGWQLSAFYNDSGLDASTQYTYTVQMRDSATPPNVGTASSGASATTDVASDVTRIASSGLTATASDQYDGSRIPANVVDESGMIGLAHSNEHPAGLMWMGLHYFTPHWFKVDLGASYDLDNMVVYNFNWTDYVTRGSKNVNVYYSNSGTDPGNPIDDPGNWTALGSAFDLTQAPGASDYGTTNAVEPDVVNFGGTTARWVSLKINSDHGGGYGGLSEILFYEESGAPTELTATAGDTAVGLDWADVADAASYNVYRSTTSGSYGAAIETGVSTSDYVDAAAVDYDTLYYYAVTAVDSSGTESDKSNEAAMILYRGDLTLDGKVDLKDTAELGSQWQTGYTMDTLLDIAQDWLYGVLDPLDLVGYWPFDETAGTAAPDASIYSHDGTLMNMDDSDWVTGNRGNALDFDGVNDYVTVDGVCAAMAGTDVTVSAWVKAPAVNPATQFIISINTSSGDNRLLCGTPAGTATLSLGDTAWHDTTATVIDNTWHHIAYVLDDSADTVTVYVDGSEVSSFASSASIAASDVFSLGQEYDAGMATSDFYNGLIDEVRIYDVALTAQEIQALQ